MRLVCRPLSITGLGTNSFIMNIAGYILLVCFLLIPAQAAQLVARLMDGSAPWVGRLELLYEEQWGTVCDDNFGQKEAQVACRMLGYNSSRAVVLPPSHMYKKESGPILLDNLMCFGSETNLDQCRYGRFYKHDCQHSEDVGISCNLKPERLRLTGLRRTRLDMGRVEVEIGSEWNVVSMSGDQTAKVVCRQLGLPYAAVLTGTYFGPEEIPRLEVGFECFGNETGLFNCEQIPIDDYRRGINMQIGVICSNSTPSLVILHNGVTYPPLEGTHFTLHCEGVQSVLPEIMIFWDVDDVARRPGKYLTFYNVTRAFHDLHVSCQANNIENSRFFGYQFLIMQVYYAPRVVRFLVNGADNWTVTVDEHSNVSIQCEADGMPVPRITLLNNTGVLAADGREDLNYNMIDTPCKATGDYRCEVENEVGQDSRRINLVVKCHGDKQSSSIRLYVVIGGVTVTVIVIVMVATVCLVRRCKGRSNTIGTADKRRREMSETRLSLQEMRASGMVNTYSAGTGDVSLSQSSGADPLYVNTADLPEVSEDSEHEYSEVDNVRK